MTGRQTPEQYRRYNKTAWQKNKGNAEFRQKKVDALRERRKTKAPSSYKISGATLEDFWKFWKAQDGKCAICYTDFETLPRRPHMDHCHKTMKLRGLLCFLCNTGIGKFEDDAELLEQAAEYIRRSS